MNRSPRSSVRVLRAVVASLIHEGADPLPLLREIGIDAATLADDEARIPFAQLERAWELVPKWSRDPSFGLHLAERATIGAFDVLDYVARSCETVADAFDRLVRYQRLLHDVVAVQVEEHGAEVWIAHRVSEGPTWVPRHAVEAAVASWILRARSLSQTDLRPKVVRFQHADPGDTTEHQRILRCPVEFSSPTNLVVLSRADFRLPIVTADTGLRAVLDRHAEHILSKLPTQGFVPQVRAALAECLRSATPDLAAVAKSLGLSPRSLQRRLAETEMKFEVLLDEFRRELAFRYLSEPDVAIGEVAFLLGYSEPSAFHRAFRRWADCTPTAYRENRNGRRENEGVTPR